MPTDEEFRIAAEFFEGAARNAQAQLDGVDESWLDAVEGGYLSELIGRTVRATIDNVASIAQQLEELKDECERRQRVCSDFDDDIRIYNKKKYEYDGAAKKAAATGLYPGPAPAVPEPAEPWITPTVRVAQ